MQQYSTEWPTLKELEARLFRMLQEQFAAALARMLEAIDEGLMRQRDHVRFRLKDVRPIQLETSVGTVRFRRRLYQDRTNGEYVFLLDRTLGFEGQRKISPFLEDVAVELAAQGPSYRKSAACLASWLGYRVMSHETIRRRLITRAEQEAKHAVETVERKPVRVLFVEADGLHVSLQRSRRKSVEHRMAVVHEGWEREGQRVRLKRKRHYIHTGSGEFWEGFGDFLLRYYDMDEQTWLVVNGDGAEWIGECESYFHRCVYTLDRFHVARSLRRFLQQEPEAWRKARRALAAGDADGLLAVVEAVSEERVPDRWRAEWEAYRAYLRRHRAHLVDYRKVLQAAGIDTTGMRPMGSAEAQMRVMAKRTKGGSYSWSVSGVRAMFRAVIARQEGRRLGAQRGVAETKQQMERKMQVRALLKEVKHQAKGCIDGMIRLLQGPYHNRPIGLALKALCK